MTPGGRISGLKTLVMAAAILLPAILAILAGCSQGPAEATGKITVPVTENPVITLPIASLVPGSGNGTTADAAMLFLTYQPAKCEKTPWMAWEEASGRRYIRAPAEEEIIAHYYSAEYNVTVRGVAKAYLHMASCEACSVCRESYWFQLTVREDEATHLIAEGWEPAA